MKRKHVKISVQVGALVVYTARLYALGDNTVVDSHAPADTWVKVETAAVLLLGALDMIDDPEARSWGHKMLGRLGHEMEGEPIMLNQEQFRATLSGDTPSVPYDLPF